MVERFKLTVTSGATVRRERLGAGQIGGGRPADTPVCSSVGQTYAVAVGEMRATCRTPAAPPPRRPPRRGPAGGRIPCCCSLISRATSPEAATAIHDSWSAERLARGFRLGRTPAGVGIRCSNHSTPSPPKNWSSRPAWREATWNPSIGSSVWRTQMLFYLGGRLRRSVGRRARAEPATALAASPETTSSCNGSRPSARELAPSQGDGRPPRRHPPPPILPGDGPPRSAAHARQCPNRSPRPGRPGG